MCLDGTCALAPGLAPVTSHWETRDLAPVYTLAIPDHTHCHFGGQAVLKAGLDRPVEAPTAG